MVKTGDQMKQMDCVGGQGKGSRDTAQGVQNVSQLPDHIPCLPQRRRLLDRVLMDDRRGRLRHTVFCLL